VGDLKEKHLFGSDVQSRPFVTRWWLWLVWHPDSDRERKSNRLVELEFGPISTASNLVAMLRCCDVASKRQDRANRWVLLVSG
jgi:hypothetical protein